LPYTLYPCSHTQDTRTGRRAGCQGAGAPDLDRVNDSGLKPHHTKAAPPYTLTLAATRSAFARGQAGAAPGWGERADLDWKNASVLKPHFTSSSAHTCARARPAQAARSGRAAGRGRLPGRQAAARLGRAPAASRGPQGSEVGLGASPSGWRVAGERRAAVTRGRAGCPRVGSAVRRGSKQRGPVPQHVGRALAAWKRRRAKAAGRCAAAQGAPRRAWPGSTGSRSSR